MKLPAPPVLPSAAEVALAAVLTIAWANAETVAKADAKQAAKVVVPATATFNVWMIVCLLVIMNVHIRVTTSAMLTAAENMDKLSVI